MSIVLFIFLESKPLTGFFKIEAKLGLIIFQGRRFDNQDL